MISLADAPPKFEAIRSVHALERIIGDAFEQLD
jgi:hypothetical protein